MNNIAITQSTAKLYPKGNRCTRIGYALVSTVDQDPELQVRALEQARCERIYTDHTSGVSRSRPELERIFDALRAGDTLVVWRFDRLGRSVSHLVDVVEQLRACNVRLETSPKVSTPARPPAKPSSPSSPPLRRWSAG